MCARFLNRGNCHCSVVSRVNSLMACTELCIYRKQQQKEKWLHLHKGKTKQCYLTVLTFHVRLFGQTRWHFHDSSGSSLNIHVFTCGEVGFVGYQMNDHGEVGESPLLHQKKGEVLTHHRVVGRTENQGSRNSEHSTWHMVNSCPPPPMFVFIFVVSLLMLVLSLLLSSTITCSKKPIMATALKYDSWVSLEVGHI